MMLVGRKLASSIFEQPQSEARWPDRFAFLAVVAENEKLRQLL